MLHEGRIPRSRELFCKAVRQNPLLILDKNALAVMYALWRTRTNRVKPPGPVPRDNGVGISGHGFTKPEEELFAIQKDALNYETGPTAATPCPRTSTTSCASEPLVSVIIPTYNAGSYLGEALDSALAQTYRRLEVIVADDGSTDETPALLRSYKDRIRVVQLGHSESVAIPRNAAVRCAQGDLLAFLDADDVWLPHKLETQVGLLKSPMALLGTSALLKTKQSRDVNKVSYRELLVRNRFAASSVMVSRSCLDQVGLFDEDPRLFGVEDWDLWLRVASRFPALWVDRELVHVRHVSGSVSAPENFSRMYRAERYLLAKHQGTEGMPQCSRLLRSHALAGSHLRAALAAQQMCRVREAGLHLLAALFVYPPSFLSRSFWGIMGR